MARKPVKRFEGGGDTDDKVASSAPSSSGNGRPSFSGRISAGKDPTPGPDAGGPITGRIRVPASTYKKGGSVKHKGRR